MSAHRATSGMIGRCVRGGQRVDWRSANWVVKAAMSAATSPTRVVRRVVGHDRGRQN